MNDNAIIRTVPAAGSLHQVPGFDPLKHLKRSVNDKGEPVMKLDLPYKRLWFRLACPNGRLLLNPLRITDQMAIFEAQVFFQREDTTPASSFTSTKTVQEDRRYIRSAQHRAGQCRLWHPVVRCGPEQRGRRPHADVQNERDEDGSRSGGETEPCSVPSDSTACGSLCV